MVRANGENEREKASKVCIGTRKKTTEDIIK